ncbi:cysteine hydrolase [Enterobacter cloacae complex sp. RIVM_C039474]|uniref:cysteine hydrolase family protein n=1 Tax=Enterobacter TaxID=547 RepID=UPI00125D0995|nr:MULTISPECIES: cysteine hydrolase family protein [Enterobacter]ELY2041648.1 cysteine hydrolase [Enterobacter ludwigii]KAB5483754.1 cysteine hydrolase [Enterobacter sp. 198]MDC4195983.1 cysteine hydrolase [Enterobacter cloacae complex sp. RIVM_C039474]WRM05833.1 cysteine hydrolase family protein [Enterobacter ludwigii]
MKTIFRTALLVSMMSAFSSQATAQETNQVNTKTIRAMSGAVATTSLSASETALIVVDIQNEYYAGQDFRGRMVIPDGADVLLKNKKLVEYAHQKGMPVYFVRHITKNNPQQNGTPLFAENSVFAQFHKDLQPIAQDTIITKETPSAFVGTDLDARLKKQGIKKVIVAGLMTHMCISSTARDAVPLGYSVIIPEDATATRDLDDGKGGVVDHDTLQRAALAGVADVFAEIMTTDQVMALAVEK